MWYLKTKGGNAFYLTQDEYIIGRKNCQINIQHDDSISRTHVKVILRDNNLYVRDCKSTYGTFILNEKLPAQTEVKVEDDTEIKLGVKATIFTAKKIPLRICYSNLTSKDKATFLPNMQVLKANHSKEWVDNCTHLTVGVVKLTSKILLALCYNVPIVSIDFWAKFVECVQNKKDPPSPKDFVPKINESLLSQNVQLEFKEERRTLFVGKMFVFLTKLSMDSISDVIKAAGGECVLWEEANITKTDLFDKKLEYLFVEENSKNYSQNSQSTISFFEAVKLLKSNGKRSIPFQEIALAVLFASCAQNCNPVFSRRDVLNVNSQTTQSQSIVFAPNTESQVTQEIHLTTQSSIPDSRENSSKVPESIPESNISINGPEYTQSRPIEHSIISIASTSKSKNKTADLENKPHKTFAEEKKKLREEMEKENPFKMATEFLQNQEKMKNKRIAEQQLTKKSRNEVPQNPFSMKGISFKMLESIPESDNSINDLEYAQSRPLQTSTASTSKRTADQQLTQDINKKRRNEGSQNPFHMRQPQGSAASKASTSTSSARDEDRITSCETTSTISEHVVVENPYGKRKATSDLNAARKKANSEIHENPFSLITKRGSTNRARANSTLQPGAKKSVENFSFSVSQSSINPSLRTANSSVIDKKVEEIANNLPRYLSLGYEVINGSLIRSTGIRSREDRLVKVEPKEETVKDEEIEKYKQSFKSMRVIVSNNIIVRKANETLATTAHNNTTIKNFKKFKKVHPKRYQTSIIPPEAYTRVVCRAQN